MVREYGSHFEWETLYGEKRRPCTEDVSVQYLRTARECLFAIGERVKRHGVNTVYMPTLCCSSMVQPFLQLNLRVRFYPLSADLTIDIPRLGAMLEDNALVLVMHYHGRRSYDETTLRNMLSKFKNVVIVQDGTQHAFTAGLYDSFADYHLASLRKWVSVADGAFLKAKVGDFSLCEDCVTPFTEMWTCAMREKQEYLKNGDSNLKESFRRRFAEGMTMLRTQPIEVHAMSAASKERFDRMNIEEIKRRRKENYEVLYAALADKYSAAVRFCVQQESPLCLPIVVEDQSGVQKALAQQGVYSQVLWPLPDGATGCENSVWFACHMLALPCDQRYTTEDARHIAACVLNVI